MNLLATEAGKCADSEPISLGVHARGGQAVDARGHTGREGALVVRRAVRVVTGAAGRPHRVCRPSEIGSQNSKQNEHPSIGCDRWMRC